MAEQIVTLNPGESEVVTFEVTPSEARAYQVSVNGLADSFVATVPLRLVPCVYCGATFITEEELISHMEANHPGMPYILSVSLSPSEIPEESRTLVTTEFFTPPLPSGGPASAFRFFLFVDGYQYEIYQSTNIYTAGFREVRKYLYIKSFWTGISVPPGLYEIKTSCHFRPIPADSGVRIEYWDGAPTGVWLKVTAR